MILMPDMPSRPIPPDLIERYLELGLKGCAAHFRARHETVARWLSVFGRDELRRLRMQQVRAKRQRAANFKSRQALHRAESRRRAVCSTEPMPPAHVVSAAAHFLRTPPGGRNMVCPSGHGDWFVGSVRVTPQDLVRRAVARGFEVEA